MNGRTLTFITLLFVAALLVMAGVGTAYPQDVSVLPEPQVVLVDEAMTFEEWVDSIIKVLLAGIGLLLTWSIKNGVSLVASVLPTVVADFVKGWIDEKRQKDLQSAIMSAVTTIIKEGRWTGNAMDVILEIKRNIVSSTPQAAEHNGVAVTAQPDKDHVLANIANRQALEVQSKLATIASQTALAKEVAANTADSSLRTVTELIDGVVKTVRK